MKFYSKFLNRVNFRTSLTHQHGIQPDAFARLNVSNAVLEEELQIVKTVGINKHV